MHAKSLLCAALAALVLTGPARAAEPSLLSTAPPEHRRLFAEIKPVILKEAGKEPLVLADSPESYFWIMAARTDPLLEAYSYSKDMQFLKAFVPLMDQIISQRYVHPTRPEWSGWFHYKGGNGFAMIDHDTILYFVPVLKFVKEVRADPKLQAAYGAKAEAWFADVQRSIRAWDRRGCWHDMGEGAGWYSNITHYPDARTGELVKMDSIHAGGSVPHNKVHALFEALGLAYRITGDPWYARRMEKCCRTFRARWREDDKHVEWNYRDHAFPGDYKSGVVGQGETKTGAFVHPKSGYYNLDVTAIVRAYDLGIFYPRQDVEKLLKTNLEFMWMGDEANPKFKKINGNYVEEGKYNKGTLWTSLAHFSDQTRALWKTRIERARESNRWMWWADALAYLIETSQPVSWTPRHAAHFARR
jgi:hypothetical protein